MPAILVIAAILAGLVVGRFLLSDAALPNTHPLNCLEQNELDACFDSEEINKSLVKTQPHKTQKSNTDVSFSPPLNVVLGLKMSNLPQETNETGSTVIQVSSHDELMSALATAAGGEIIMLAAGDYGDLSLYDARQPYAKFASEVTIQSADPDYPATITSLDLRGVANLTFDNINFDYSAEPGVADWEKPFVVNDSTGISIRNSTFDGDLAEGLDEARDGYGTGTGLSVSNSSDILVENNSFFNFARAGVFGEVENLVIKGNDVHDIRSDGFDFADVDNVLIEDNYIHDFKSAEGSGDHVDMIQFWTTGTSSPTTNVVIRGNFLDSGEGSETQSIFMRNEVVDLGLAGFEMFYQNITIEDNIIYNAHTHGITVGETVGLSIQNNTILHNADAGNDGLVNVPTINVSDAAQNVVVANNIVPRLSLTSSSEHAVQNNLVVQSSNPDGANYVGELFVNALTGSGATLADLKAVPGSIIAQMGVGSPLTQFDTTPTTPAGFVVNEAGSGLNLLQHSFNISNIYGLEGQIDLEGALVTWDFGDGSGAEGTAADHTFAKAGSYDIGATVTLSDGRIVEINKLVQVETPVAVRADFDNGAQDLSDISNAVTIGENVNFESNGDGQAVRLNGDIVSYEGSQEFFNNSEYSVVVDFKKDAGSETDAGRLINFSGSFVVMLEADGVRVAVTTDKGSVWLEAFDIGIVDSNWHSLVLTFSGANGVAALYLDGNEIARADGLDGATQIGDPGHSIHLGDPWGDGFSGLIDNFAFLRGALSADQIQSGVPIVDQLGSVTDTANPDSNLEPALQTGPSVAGETELEPALPNRIDGTDGKERIDGTDGADEIHGNGGKDQIFAGGGDDAIYLGGTNWGMADGGAGDDLLVGHDANDKLFGGEGQDTLNGGAGSDQLFGGAGNDLLRGGTGRDWLFGDAGDDVLIASDANHNSLDGGEGNDSLLGGTGRDYLSGGAGNDVLIGGEGNDDLTGGQGQDQFIFGPNSGQDRLFDLNPLEDIIVLQGLGDLTVADMIERAFEVRGDLILNLDEAESDFSWSSSDYVRLVGVSMEELTDANISLVA